MRFALLLFMSVQDSHPRIDIRIHPALGKAFEVVVINDLVAQALSIFTTIVLLVLPCFLVLPNKAFPNTVKISWRRRSITSEQRISVCRFSDEATEHVVTAAGRAVFRRVVIANLDVWRRRRRYSPTVLRHRCNSFQPIRICISEWISDSIKEQIQGRQARRIPGSHCQVRRTHR